MALVRLVGRVLQAVLGAGATVVVTLKAAGEADPSDAVFVVAVVILALTAAVDPIAVGIRHFRGRRGLELSADVTDVLTTLLVRVVERTNLDWTRVGVHAFLVRRRFRHCFRQELVRVGRVRMSKQPPPSGIRWSRGKGVIGLCWDRQTDVGEDLLELQMPYLKGSEAEWNNAPPEVRLGLEWHEFRRTQGYGTVVASPMLDAHERLRGCVSVDAPGKCLDVLFDREVRSDLQDAAELVWRLAS